MEQISEQCLSQDTRDNSNSFCSVTPKCNLFSWPVYCTIKIFPKSVYFSKFPFAPLSHYWFHLLLGLLQSPLHLVTTYTSYHVLQHLTDLSAAVSSTSILTTAFLAFKSHLSLVHLYQCLLWWNALFIVLLCGWILLFQVQFNYSCGRRGLPWSPYVKWQLYYQLQSLSITFLFSSYHYLKIHLFTIYISILKCKFHSVWTFYIWIIAEFPTQST